MDREQYRRAREIFHAACEVSPEARAAFLDQQCADAALRAAVQRLLDADTPSQEGFLEQPLGQAGKLEELADDHRANAHGLPALKRVGQYRVVEALGAGGMGVVYKAQQEHPRRIVALKVLRPGLMSEALLKRFRREADLLGRLQHPGIAHVYEAGVAEVETEQHQITQQPFFAMEYIVGEPLDQHARSHDLDERARLALFADICEAVQHAHERGVIHRDLKPGNILVGPDGRPKVLDFGVSRATDADVQAVSLETNVGQMVGTLPYMSPEQVAGDPGAIDARSDVYSLGVVLYELLAGKLPHDLSDRSIPEAIRVIQQQDPERLSAIHSRFRGDIETIVAKALEKDRTRRYATAGELAADIRRRLRDEPIMARPPGSLYLMHKFARRNKTVVAGLAATFAALIVGLAATMYGLVSARAERDAKEAALRQEQTSREIAETVAAFFTEMLACASPAAQGRNVTVREVLDKTASQIGDRFHERPEIEAIIRTTMGQTYVSLGAYDLAEDQIARAVAIRRSLHDESDPKLIETESLLSGVYYYQGRLNDATDLAGKVLEQARQAFPPDDPKLIEPLSNAAFLATRSGRLDFAEQHFLEAVSVLERAPNAKDLTVVELKGNLAQLYGFMNRPDDAEAAYLQLIPFAQQTIGPEHPQTILLMSNLASVYKNAGEFAKAIPLTRQTLEIQERVLGRGHSQVLITLNNLADALRAQGHLAEAEELLLDGLARADQAYGQENASTGFLKLTLGQVYQNQGRLEESELALSQSLALHRRLVGGAAEITFRTVIQFIDLRLQQSQFQQAAEQAQELMEQAAAAHGEGHPRAARARQLLARAYSGLGRFEEAERLLLREHETAAPRDRPRIAELLAKTYDAWGKTAEARRWRE